MTNPILKWWQDQKQWRADHLRAFEIVKAKGADGLTVFQRDLASVLSAAPFNLKFELGNSEDGDQYLWGNVEKSDVKVYVYEKECGYFTGEKWFIFEEWDFRTPDELVNKFISELRHHISPNLPLHTDAVRR
jgi:hypothetical protein